ncbi:EamA family transporter [Acidilobus sp.]|uniref:EamA family transporter n=1 Tax=Acidilobus sp. TaxID=1872109 RepID=UPI003D00E757
MIPRAAALAMAVSVGVAFGVHDAVAKMKLEGADPSLLSFSTLLAGLPLLAIMLPFAGGLRLTLASAGLFIAAGIVNFSVGRTLMYAATSRLSSSGASVMTSSSAAFSILMSLFLGERITLSIVLGVIAIMAGVYLASDWGTERFSLSGLGLGLATGFAIASSVAIIKLGDLYGGSPGLGVIIAYLSGLVALSPRASLSLLRRFGKPVAIMGLAAALGQLLRYVALTSLEVDVATPLQNLRPIVTTALLYGATREAGKHPMIRHWAAACVAFLGILLVSGAIAL